MCSPIEITFFQNLYSVSNNKARERNSVHSAWFTLRDTGIQVKSPVLLRFYVKNHKITQSRFFLYIELYLVFRWTEVFIHVKLLNLIIALHWMMSFPRSQGVHSIKYAIESAFSNGENVVVIAVIIIITIIITHGPHCHGVYGPESWTQLLSMISSVLIIPRQSIGITVLIVYLEWCTMFDGNSTQSASVFETDPSNVCQQNVIPVGSKRKGQSNFISINN